MPRIAAFRRASISVVRAGAASTRSAPPRSAQPALLPSCRTDRLCGPSNTGRLETGEGRVCRFGAPRPRRRLRSDGGSFGGAARSFFKIPQAVVIQRSCATASDNAPKSSPSLCLTLVPRGLPSGSRWQASRPPRRRSWPCSARVAGRTLPRGGSHAAGECHRTDTHLALTLGTLRPCGLDSNWHTACNLLRRSEIDHLRPMADVRG